MGDDNEGMGTTDMVLLLVLGAIVVGLIVWFITVITKRDKETREEKARREEFMREVWAQYENEKMNTKNAHERKVLFANMLISAASWVGSTFGGTATLQFQRWLNNKRNMSDRLMNMAEENPDKFVKLVTNGSEFLTNTAGAVAKGVTQGATAGVTRGFGGFWGR